MDTSVRMALREAMAAYQEAISLEDQKKSAGAIVDLLAPEFKIEAKMVVDALENDPMATTRGNYGRYGAALAQFKGFYRLAFIKALRDAGAGQGLNDALRVF